MTEKRDKSVGDHLIRTDIQKRKTNYIEQLTKKRGTFACLACQNCTSIIKGDTVHHPIKGHPIKMRGYHTCNATIVIYLFCFGLPCAILTRYNT